MKCRVCQLEHDPMMQCGRAMRMEIARLRAELTRVNADRHRPGYMAEYMRRDRAKKKAAKRVDCGNG